MSAALGSSPKTPGVTSDNAAKNRRTTPRRSERIASRNCAALRYQEPAPRTPEQLKSVNAKDSSGDLRSPGRGCTNNAEEVVTPSRVRESHASLCGKKYVYLARLRSHEKECKECISLQPPESKSAAQVHEEINKILDDSPTMHADCASCSHGTRNNKMETRKSDASEHDLSKKTAEDADNCIQIVHAALIHAINEDLSEDEREGYLYMISTPEKEGLVKIGYSIHPLKRMKEHRKCIPDFKLIRISDRVKAIKRAERLIKIDLINLRRKWNCPSCNNMHEEWFEITETEVMVVINRWVSWINDHHPYNNDKQLNLMWAFLINYVRLLPGGIDGDDHSARWSHWDRVLSEPLAEDIARFDQYGRQKTTKKGDKGIPDQIKEGTTAVELPFRPAPSDVRPPVRPLDVAERIGQTMIGGGGTWIENVNVNYTFQYCFGGKASMERIFQD